MCTFQCRDGKNDKIFTLPINECDDEHTAIEYKATKTTFDDTERLGLTNTYLNYSGRFIQ